jgi:hypothetical protein
MQPSLLKRIAACAPGKRITVFVPSGEVYELPLAPKAAPVEPPSPIETLSKQLLERDAQARAAAAEANARSDEALTAVKEAIGAVATGQAQVAESVNEMAGTLHLPVKPVYDKSGKLIGAQRVKKLGA